MKIKYDDGIIFSPKYSVNPPITTCNAKVTFTLGSRHFVLKTSGKAKCSPEDKFDEDFGRDLAEIRAKQKIDKGIERKLIQYSNKNSELKKDKLEERFAKLIGIPTLNQLINIKLNELIKLLNRNINHE